MSFGFSVSDFLNVLKLAKDWYAACRDGPGEYREIASEAKSLRFALRNLSNDAKNSRSLLSRKGAVRKNEMLKLVRNCELTFEELLMLVEKHRQLVTDRNNVMVRVWHAYQVGSSDLDTIRGKLTFHTSVISMFLLSLESSAISRIESTLDKIYAQLVRNDVIQASHSRESLASTTSMLDQLQDDEEGAWASLREQLLAENISMASVIANKSEVIAYMKTLISDNALVEDKPRSVLAEQTPLSPCMPLSPQIKPLSASTMPSLQRIHQQRPVRPFLDPITSNMEKFI